MDFVNAPLLAAAFVVFVSLVAGLFSARIGLSFLLVFLLAGILVGEDGIVGLPFDDFVLSFWVGNLALAVILLDGGLRTSIATFRTGLKPALALATLGVVISAAVTALAAMWLLDLDWRTGMLLGAVVGSTDAAAVFALLKRSSVTLNERVEATLEIESGMNDPMAVYLTLAFIALLTAGASASSGLATMLESFARQFGGGIVFGLGVAWLVVKMLGRLSGGAVPGGVPGGGLMALLLLSAGLVVFAAAGLAGGSGFLAIYLFGLVLANAARDAVAEMLDAMDGYAWLAQACMFLLLGLLVTPSQMMQTVGPALGIAAVLMFVARPLAVWLCLIPFRFSARETWFISWVGLRGAVPIVLAIFPLIAGIPQAMLIFNVAFVVVLVSLLLQGATLGIVARRLGIALPDPQDERSTRAVFRDFALDPSMPMREVCAFYELPVPKGEASSVAAWLADALRRPPVAGDTVGHGHAVFVVRAVDEEGRIARVGLGLMEPGRTVTLK